jgi:hypothetical protein
MITEEISVQIERDLVKALDDIKVEKGMTDAEWGDRAFDKEKAGRRKIQNLKQGLIRLRVGDFVKMSRALEAPTSRLFDRALDKNGL